MTLWSMPSGVGPLEWALWSGPSGVVLWSGPLEWSSGVVLLWLSKMAAGICVRMFDCMLAEILLTKFTVSLYLRPPPNNVSIKSHGHIKLTVKYGRPPPPIRSHDNIVM